MVQISLFEIMKQEFRQNEIERPWFLQVSSAPLLKFKGELAASPNFDKFHPTRLEKGTFGFINGSQSGEYDAFFQSRRKHCYVNYMDLEPMKVTELTNEEKERSYPKPFEYVEVVSTPV
ncbi:hypothetical protein [Siminovitchia terrae]|uniref:hypothetical protein n=1 Tax=Siminovitchia terrae TaxID=1914933 RepID=UPI0028B05838|nr:hypothetical protein [Siminovitchia terrae]